MKMLTEEEVKSKKEVANELYKKIFTTSVGFKKETEVIRVDNYVLQYLMPFGYNDIYRSYIMIKSDYKKGANIFVEKSFFDISTFDFDSKLIQNRIYAYVRLADQYMITNLADYPDTGEHQECFINIPCFSITKGHDCFFWKDKNGEEHSYNNYKTTVDKRWIVTLNESEASSSLKEIFEIKTSKDVHKIIEYCVNLYRKSLKMELAKIEDDLNIYIKY